MTTQDDPCAPYRALLSPALDQELSPREEMALARHLEGCPSCREARARLFETVAVLRRTPFVDVTPDFLGRLDERLERESASKLETIARADLDLATAPTMLAMPAISPRRKLITSLKAAAMLACIAGSTFFFVEALEHRGHAATTAKFEQLIPAAPTPQPEPSASPNQYHTTSTEIDREAPIPQASATPGPIEPAPEATPVAPVPSPEPTPAAPLPVTTTAPAPSPRPTSAEGTRDTGGETPAPQPTPAPVRGDKELAHLLAAIFTDPSTPAEQRPNLIVALAEFAQKRSTDALGSILGGALDGRPLARENRASAVTALGKLGTEEAARVLLAADAAVEEAALVAALSRVRGSKGVELIASRAADAADANARIRFTRALGDGGQPEALRGLTAILRSTRQPPLVRAEAARALGGLATAAGLAAKRELVWALDQVGLPVIRGAAAQGLGRLAPGRVPVVTELAAALTKDAHPYVREQCALALSRTADVAAVKPLVDRLDPRLESSRRVRAAAANALLAATGKRRSLEEWRKALAGSTPPVVSAPGAFGPVVLAGDWAADLVTGDGTVFVLDRSGSMGERGKMDLAKRTIADCLDHLPESPRDPGPRGFSLVFFADAPVAAFPRLVEPSPDNLVIAHKGIERQRATYAPTDLLRAIKSALALDGVDTIVLVTDGLPTLGVRDPNQLLVAVGRENAGHGARIHVVALEDGTTPLELDAAPVPPANEAAGLALLRRLALDSGGVFVKN